MHSQRVKGMTEKQKLAFRIDLRPLRTLQRTRIVGDWLQIEARFLASSNALQRSAAK
jgi:hypothetical protein